MAAVIAPWAEEVLGKLPEILEVAAAVIEDNETFFMQYVSFFLLNAFTIRTVVSFAKETYYHYLSP